MDPPLLVLAAGLVVLAAALLHESRGTVFFFDEWSVWGGRYGFSDLDQPFAPINGHLSAVPILIFSLLTKVFGAESHLPFRISVVVFHAGFLGLLFLLARRRVGGWLALAVVAPLAVPASGWVVLLMPFTGLFQIGPLIAVLAAVLALDRRTRWGDALAMTALFLGILTAGSGLAALAAATVYLAVAEGWSRALLQRAWVVAIPAVAYAAWSLHYNPDTQADSSTWDMSPATWLVASTRAPAATSRSRTGARPSRWASSRSWSSGRGGHAAFPPCCSRCSWAPSVTGA